MVWLTTRLRDRMGYRLWQVIHRTASVGWVLVIAHGLMAGTDTRATWAIVTYAACAGVVMGLMVPRMVIGNRTGTRGAVASDARSAGSAHS